MFFDDVLAEFNGGYRRVVGFTRRAPSDECSVPHLAAIAVACDEHSSDVAETASCIVQDSLQLAWFDAQAQAYAFSFSWSGTSGGERVPLVARDTEVVVVFPRGDGAQCDGGPREACVDVTVPAEHRRRCGSVFRLRVAVKESARPRPFDPFHDWRLAKLADNRAGDALGDALI